MFGSKLDPNIAGVDHQAAGEAPTLKILNMASFINMHSKMLLLQSHRACVGNAIHYRTLIVVL